MRQGLTTYYGTVNGGGRTEEEDAMRSGDRCGLGVQASKGQLERACPLCHVTVRYGRWGVWRRCREAASVFARDRSYSVYAYPVPGALQIGVTDTGSRDPRGTAGRGSAPQTGARGRSGR